MAFLQLLLFILLVFGGNSSRLESVVGTRIKVGNETDRLSLLEFKKQIADPYGALSSWNDSIHFCNWIGVTCGRRHQRVIGLKLNGKGLGGNISPSIGNLSFLHSLSIANNSFHGEIPKEIGNLIRLQYMSLRNNTLQGEIPTSLANCTRLIKIGFSFNNFVGKIPVELTSLSKLEIISINCNGLTGELPASFGNMSSLQIISFVDNGLWGRIPESLSQLTNLYELDLGVNKLSGMFPLSIYNLSSLQVISVTFNRLQGSLPLDISLTLPNLQILVIPENLFSGSIPNSISNISTLVVVDLGHNNFVGPVPNNLGNLQKLQYFSIGENQCGAREANDLGFLNSLLNCTNLEMLPLWGNGFKGPLPNFKANLSSQLSLFDLDENQISGPIPDGIENLVNLTALALDNNFLEGNIPPGIGKLPKLQRLFLSGNKLSGQIPSSIGNLTLLFELHLDANNLNATIPFSLGNCQKLQYLTLAHNNLRGPIPRELFHLSSLSISLDLSYNSLVGSLLGDIGNLKSLSTLDISKNRLFGEIPSSIGDCNSLEHLYMGYNLFEGTIPQSMTLLKGLQDLDLSHNNLSEKIPKDLEKLFALQSLNLSFNNLEGEVPTNGVFGNASAIFLNGNYKLCGGIANLQLPACTNHGSTKQEKFPTLRIVLAIISVVLGFILISSLLTLYWTRKSKSKPPSTILIGDQFLKISYKELFQATGGFSSANFIGSGSFGYVYKAVINQDEKFVAVKVLNLQNPKAYKSFMIECEALRNIQHRNLVKIITSCSSLDSKGNDFKALVYEFMPNGSLDDWLHLPMEANNHSRKLNLLQRLNIAIDVASALEYLHCHCYAPIVHCDLKPSNVLLDCDMTAHVSDFGLARLLLESDDNSSQTQNSTIGIKGSIGYVAPVFGGNSSRLESVVGTRIKVGNETDRLSLLEFKKQIADPYGALSSWNDSIHFCNWVGVTCGRRHQRITGLDLQGKGLGGNISPSIGNLSFLHLLDIANNSFHGEIPQEIGNLIRLQYIHFENNTLQGELPTCLANCTRLIEIHFSRNNLVGKIPVELTSLSKLEWISINNGGLTGELPVSFGNMSSLQILSLSENGLWGRIPESLSQLTNLYELYLGVNKLSGMFPLSIYNLSYLQIISLTDNRLHGSLPRDISLTLPNLQLLFIGDNLFSGSIPNSISNISTLVKIDLAENSFGGLVPNNLENLQNLQFFSIAHNQCGAKEADDLGFLNSLLNCTNLETLFLGPNGFNGPLPNLKANILSSQLSILQIEENQISGTIPDGIENLVNLTVLALDNNFLEGNIPSGIGKLSKLQVLYLNGNRLSGHIPSSIGNLTLLFKLQLEANNLNATIPSSLGNCQKLQYLTLAGNNLQGPIPTELFHLSSLSISLDLSYNSLVGSLPRDIGNLNSLSEIDISKNRLSGEIPSSIGDCNSLEYLYMGDNLFEGTIPQSLTLLKGLQDLDLSHNNLSEKIPKDLEKLSALQSLNLSFNNLEGEVPTKGVFGNASAISVNGNDKLCGGIAGLQLPTCTNHGSTKQEKFHTFKIVSAIISAVLGFIMISSLLTLYWTRKSKSKPPSTTLIGDQFFKISYKELFQATGGFSSTNFIGSGSFGSVYKGIINQIETFVAVKVLHLQNPKAYKSFMTECEALRNIRHRNLVKILTSCSSLDSKGNDFKALVYEFMPNGNLDDWLHLPMETNNHSRKLNLLQRLNIAIDVASALEYLHCHCYMPIVHCDLKPSNVLLDCDMTAHVSDFGLARLLLESDDNSSQTQNSTIGIKGSIGYVAPEYGMGGKATVEGDMFSYGILLLEMFTGKRPTDQIFTEYLNLHNFAKAALSDNVMKILDPTLLPKEEYGEEIEEESINRAEGPYHMTDKLQDCVMSVIKIALQCSMDSPRERMNMNNVVKELRLIKCNFLGGRIY